MKNEDIVSIIVPVYNVENYLDRCINSIKNQSYTNIEIILVDDGSTDTSGDICDKQALTDERIFVIHKNNGGLSDARNTGIKSASGKWLAFIDGDDFIAKDTIMTMYSSAVQNNCQISICNILRYYEDNSTEIFFKSSDIMNIFSDENRFKVIEQPSVCNKLFYKELFNSIEFPIGKYYEDTFVFHELVYLSKKIVITDYDGYFYFYRTSGILNTSKNNDKYFDFIEAVYKRMIFFINKKISKYDIEACLSLYAAFSTAIKNIKKTNINKHKFIQSKKWYKIAYRYLINNKQISIKQKIRLFLLYYSPLLHKFLY